MALCEEVGILPLMLILLLRHVRREWALLSFHSVCLSVSHSATYSLPRLISHNQICSAGIYLSLDPCKPFWIPYLPYFRCQRENMQNFAYLESNAYSCHCERDASCHMTCLFYSSSVCLCHISVSISTKVGPLKSHVRVVWTVLYGDNGTFTLFIYLFIIKSKRPECHLHCSIHAYTSSQCTKKSYTTRG